MRAAAAARRLDDTFRAYLAERGAKPVPLPEVDRPGHRRRGPAARRATPCSTCGSARTARPRATGPARARELLGSTETVRGWYDDLATSLVNRSPVRDPLPPDPTADGRLVEAVRTDLVVEDGRASATAVRLIWTGDHLDAARRLQASLVEPARAVTRQRELGPRGRLGTKAAPASSS